MAECGSVENILCSESDSSMHPTHSFGTGSIPEKHVGETGLPNGKIKLSGDNNGLIQHLFDKEHILTSVEIGSETNTTQNQNENCSKEESQETFNSIDNTACSSKSSDSPAAQLSSDFESLDITKIPGSAETNDSDSQFGISYVEYESERQMTDIMRLITKDLSEPYSIYTYRYFIHNWPKLCFLAMDKDKCVGAIVCKLDMHKKMVRRGYIAMLAIDSEYRRRKIGSRLVLKAIKAMISDDCDEVVLETEITNEAALRLYENLGFVRDKRLFRYYLNGVDALRLKLWLR